MVTGVFLPVAAQTTAPQIGAEFRTAPRSLITRAIDLGRVATVEGAVHREAATAQDLGARDPSARLEHLQLVLQRPQERQAAFDAEVIALHQFGGPSYHQWLTPEVIGTEFGPSASDMATLTNYLRSEGFSVDYVGKSGMFVDFSGTVEQVQQSFHIAIHNLRLATGEGRYGAVSEGQLPEALTPLVAGFIPIGNLTPHPLVVPVRPPAHSPARAGSTAKPNDTKSGGNYYVGAQDFYTIYNETPLINAGTVTGSGVTIALLEDSDIDTNDVTTFRTMMGVTPALPTLSVMHDAAIHCHDPGVTGDEGEAVLDTEWAGATAPGATLLFMSCGQGRIDLSAEAVIDNNVATVMSLSFGETEVGNPSEATTFSNLWEQATAQGETVVVSSGDVGSANTQDQGSGATIVKNGLDVNGLASSPYDVAAGGTDFQDYYNQDEGDSSFTPARYWNPSNGADYSSALSYVAEMPWNNTCASSILSYYYESGNPDPNALCDDATYTNDFKVPTGGGGGVSTLQARPTWQNGTDYGLNVAPISTYANRLLPDISLFAANGIWGHALDFYQSDAGGPLAAGGTSFVAPQLAGIFALIAQKTGERLGQPNFVLYNMAGVEFGTTSYTAGSTCNGSGATSNVGTTSTVPASTCIFYDIQTGNNSQACSTGSPNCYTKTGSYGILSTSTTSAQIAYPGLQGYDLATGIGSVNITNLVNNWQNAAAGGITYTPTVTVSPAASYPYGSPTAITYTATVSGSGSFPTGSVTFSGSPTISTIGNEVLIASSCSGTGTCTESATQAYTPPGNLAVGSYTITGAYLTTNENYASGSGTTGLTVNKQTPTVAVSAVTIGVGAATANFSATISYVGSGVIAPTGGLTFQVDSGTAVTATCMGSSSPLTCTYTGYNTPALSAGNHTLTATSIADGNYATASGGNTLKVLPLPTITFSVPNRHTMDLPFTVSATSNSSGAIAYSVVSGPATISGNLVTLTGVAGNVVLQASQVQSASYAAGTQNASFSVIAGSVWFGNGTGSLSTFDLTGTAITGTSGITGGGVGTIAAPLGLALDASGNMWVASSTGVSEFSRQGVAIASTPYTVGGVSNPLAIAVDGAGQIWVANSAGTVSVLSNTGTAVSPSTGYSGPGSKPAGIAIDVSGNVWIPSSTANTVTRILGVAAPVVPLATGAASGPGGKP